MPTNFERAKQVIDALVPVAERLVPDGSVDDMVRRRLNSLSAAYQSGMLRANREPVDYSKTTTHIAYVYRALPAHADWLFKSLSRASLRVMKALPRGTVKVACIGGGPGSDLLGVAKFALAERLCDRRFKFFVLDRQAAWWRARSELVSTFDKELRIAEAFQELDLAAGPPWTPDNEYLQSDVFTFSFVLSEVWSFDRGGSVTGFLNHLVDGAKRGALFCYVDNGGPNFTPKAEAVFGARRDLELIETCNDERMLLSFDEQCNVVENEYRERFGQRPKLFGNVATRIWVKR